jgi:gliding motility-associated-like protein
MSQITRKLLLFLLLVNIFVCSYAQVVINEYSCSNINTITDNNGNNEDWIELFNTSATAVNIGGYYLSDKPATPMKWMIPVGTTIPANGRRIFWASGKDVLVGGNNQHTNFKLTQMRYENIVLADASGVIIDQVALVPTQGDHSRGRITDGNATFGVFTTPTPNAANAGSFTDYVSKPTFNVAPGFYTATQSVTITCSDPNTQIRYTTNGTTPTATSTLYSAPISVATTTAIRARAFSTTPNFAPSFIETNTYFINVSHTMPVISLCGSFTNFFNTAQDIKNTIEYFDVAQTLQYEMDGDMRKHGNDSWAYSQKGMRFYVLDEYGYANNIEYQQFPTSPRDEFDVIILKAAGSDNYPDGGGGGSQPCHLRDSYVQGLSEKNNLNLDVRRLQSAIVYINGGYWGIYEVRERVDSDYTAYYYNQEKEDIDQLRYWGGLNIEEGSDTAWNNLFDYIMANPMTVQANYDYVVDKLDPMSLIDNFILNTYVNNSDWLNWNTSWWRGRKNTANTPKVRWRYDLWDEDNTFDLGQNYTGLPGGTSYTNDPCEVTTLFTGPNIGPEMGHVKIFNKLMDNQVFKDAYVNRYADLTNTAFRCDSMLAFLQRFEDKLTPEMPAHVARWGGSIAGWQAGLQHIRDEINGRCAVIDSGIVGCYNVTGPFAIGVNVVPAGSGNVQISTQSPSIYWHNTDFFGGTNIPMKATPTTGYVFDYWEVLNHGVSPNTLQDSVSINLTSSDSVIAHFKPIWFVANDTTLCSSPTPFYIFALGGINYQWTILGSSNVLGTTDSLSISPTQTTSYVVTATTLAGVEIDTITVTVNQMPIFSLSATDPLALCDVANLNLNPQLSNIPTVAYSWQDGSTNPTFNVSTSGQYYLIADNNGCIYSDTVNITMGITPDFPTDFNITGGTVGQNGVIKYCDMPNILLDPGLSTMPNTTLVWQDGSTNQTFNITQSGTYWVVATNNGCTYSDSVTVTVGVTPSFTNNFGVTSNMLNSNGAMQFCDVPNIMLDPQLTTNPNTTFQWQDGSTNPTYNITASGTYWLIAENNGCKYGDTIRVMVGITPIVNLGLDSTFCGSVTNLKVLDAGNVHPNTVYTWHDGIHSQTYNATQTGTYSVFVNNEGCTDADTVHLQFGEMPYVELGDDVTLCPNESVRLDATGSQLTYLWQDGTKNTAYIATTPGEYWVQVKTLSGCTARDTVYVLPSQLINFDLGVGGVLCVGDSVHFSVTVPNGANYTWSNGKRNEDLVITKPGTYQIDVYHKGCHVHDEMVYENENCERCQVFIPSAFSPNADGYNDIATFVASCPVNKWSIVIYDRFGKLIFEGTNVGETWNGTANGKAAPEGVYIYSVKCTVSENGTDKQIQQGGTITLIR